MIVKSSLPTVDKPNGHNGPGRSSSSRKNTKTGTTRLRAIRLNRKLFLALHSASEKVTPDCNSASHHVTSQTLLPPSPTAFARLPDPKIRIAYQAKLFLGEHQEQANLRASPREQERDDFVLLEGASGDESDEEEMRVVPRRTTAIKFQPFVQVVEIPSHEDYSKSDHKKQWNSKKRIRIEARRNRLEYKADGFDWRNCKEEEDMVELSDGELVHPHTYYSRLSNNAGDEEAGSFSSTRSRVGQLANKHDEKPNTQIMVKRMLWHRE